MLGLDTSLIDASAATAVAGAGLLILAGLPKVGRPLPLQRALASVDLRVSRAGARGIAVAEVVLGGAALLMPGRVTMGGLAGSYLAFTGFVLLARARGGVLESCGCFGEPDTPPTLPHALVTFGIAAAAAGASLSGWAWATSTMLPVVLGAAILGLLSWLVIAVLPTVTPASIASVRRETHASANRPSSIGVM